MSDNNISSKSSLRKTLLFSGLALAGLGILGFIFKNRIFKEKIPTTLRGKITYAFSKLLDKSFNVAQTKEMINTIFK